MMSVCVMAFQVVNSSTPKQRPGRSSAGRRSNDYLSHASIPTPVIHMVVIVTLDTSMASSNHSMEMEEIDARLSALQQFMKKSLDSVQNTSNR